MPSRSEIVAALRSTFTSFGDVVTGLTPEQWRAQSLCPLWDMRHVVLHVTAIEAALVGWRPGDESPFAKVGALLPDLDALSDEALLAHYRQTTADRLAELEEMDDELFATESFTPVGVATYGRFMEIRVFDMWVHERDIRVPLGIPGDDAGLAAEMSLDEVHKSLGYIVGKKIGLADGLSIAFEVTGPTPRTLYAAVDGRAKVVDEVVDPTVVVATDSLTFMLLACGRIDPAGPIEDGRVTVHGDEALGHHAASNLAFTM